MKALIDPLRPIVGTNRDEYFLIEFDGFVRNMTEALIHQSYIYHDYTLCRYPAMQEYWNMSGYAKYSATNRFTPMQFLHALDREGLDDVDVMKDIEKFQSVDVMQLLTDTIVDVMIPTLQRADCTKSIHIIKDTDWHKFEYMHVKNEICVPAKSELQLFSGDTESICADHRYTTIFTTNPGTIRNLIESDPDKYKLTLFMVKKYFGQKDELRDLSEKGYAIQFFDVDYAGSNKLTKASQPMG